MLEITAAGMRFVARWEDELAPKTVAAFKAILPLDDKIIHCRWSGESNWIPWGDRDLGIGPENATSYPHPGELALYPGGQSETELLFPYGYCSFASKAGHLWANHFATLVEGQAQLRELGRLTLWQGAQPISFREVQATAVELVYETHSTTLDNENGIATGWLDGELSPHGRAQARELGERRREASVVYASDLGRAVETVEIAFGETAIPVHFDTRLRECDYGELNGHPVEEVTAERSGRVEVPFPGGQSYRDVVDRTASLLEDVRARHDGQTVVLIGHSANLLALQHLLDGRPLQELVDAPFGWQEGWRFRLDSAGPA